MRALIPLLALLASPAMAQPAEPSCANIRAALPSELAGWSQQTPVSAGVKAGEGATLEVGHAALVSLHPAKHLAFKTDGAADANGGTLALAVTKAGTYRVALGEAASIDLIADGKAVTIAARAAGPRCTGVKRLVDFTLKPGNYTVQLSGSAADSVALLVVRV